LKQKIISNALKDICEAVGCAATARIKVPVKVGQQGIILLHLCHDCMHKFREEKLT
jgi:hypothetical protein